MSIKMIRYASQFTAVQNNTSYPDVRITFRLGAVARAAPFNSTSRRSPSFIRPKCIYSTVHFTVFVRAPLRLVAFE